MQFLSSLIGLLITKAYASPYFDVYCNALGTYCGDGQSFIRHLALRTANVLIIPAIGGVAVIAVLWAAIKMISSFGEDQGKEDAKKIIIAACVGIGLAVAGVAIVHWVCEVVILTTDGDLGFCG